MASRTSARSSAPAPRSRSRARRQPPTVRRQDLLAVTIGCLARLGPRGTTGRAICREAGVSHGLLRHYFDNPDNLLLETYQQLCDHFVERFQAVLAADENPWLALDRFFGVIFDGEWKQSDILGAWMAFWSLVRSNEEFARVGNDYNGRVRELLATALDRLPRSRDALGLDQAIPILSAVMDGLWLECCIAPERLQRDRAVELWRTTIDRLMT